MDNSLESSDSSKVFAPILHPEYQTKMKRVLVARCGVDFDAAGEIVQMANSMAIAKIAQFDPSISSIRTWFSKYMLRSAYRDYNRHLHRHRGVSLDLNGNLPIGEGFSLRELRDQALDDGKVSKRLSKKELQSIAIPSTEWIEVLSKVYHHCSPPVFAEGVSYLYGIEEQLQRDSAAKINRLMSKFTSLMSLELFKRLDHEPNVTNSMDFMAWVRAGYGNEKKLGTVDELLEIVYRKLGLDPPPSDDIIRRRKPR